MTAPDLIPALCPNCGGKLNVDPALDTMLCQFCNTEHIIRRNVTGTVSLEAYARCPLCRRNDQAEKISAILNKQTSLSSGLIPQQQIYTDDKGAVHSRTIEIQVETTHETSLAQKLAAPQKPVQPVESAAWPYLLVAVASGVFAIYRIIRIVIFNWAFTIGPAVLILFAMILAIVTGIIWRQMSTKGKQQFIEKTKTYQTDLVHWKRAFERWQALYYCGRDDVVFIPADKTCASVADMIKYIYSEANQPGK